MILYEKNLFKLNSKLREAQKRVRKKLKQFSIILTEPISINSLSNSTNKLHFHCQKANYLSKLQKLSECKKKLLNFILTKKQNYLIYRIFSGLFITVPPH